MNVGDAIFNYFRKSMFTDAPHGFKVNDSLISAELNPGFRWQHFVVDNF